MLASIREKGFVAQEAHERPGDAAEPFELCVGSRLGGRAAGAVDVREMGGDPGVRSFACGKSWHVQDLQAEGCGYCASAPIVRVADKYRSFGVRKTLQGRPEQAIRFFCLSFGGFAFQDGPANPEPVVDIYCEHVEVCQCVAAWICGNLHRHPETRECALGELQASLPGVRGIGPRGRRQLGGGSGLSVH